jgi:hypothetical protein
MSAHIVQQARRLQAVTCLFSKRKQGSDQFASLGLGLKSTMPLALRKVRPQRRLFPSAGLTLRVPGNTA